MEIFIPIIADEKVSARVQYYQLSYSVYLSRSWAIQYFATMHADRLSPPNIFLSGSRQKAFIAQETIEECNTLPILQL